MHERDPINFDFRVVALLTIMVTRPDLLHEYVADGRDKDGRGVPLALNDPNRWVTLRRLGFSADLLAEMLFLFERRDVGAALRTTQRLFATMLAMRAYCELQCPDDDWSGRFVASTRQLTQPLNPAGVEED